MQLLTNAKVYTMDDARHIASAIAIDGGRILAVGDTPTLLAEFGHRCKAENLQGRAILPGLTDAHLHLQHYSLGLDMVNCETATRAEALQRIARRALDTPPGQWIQGLGFNQNVWSEGAGNAHDLDLVAPNHPVYIVHKSIHSAWVNTRALELAGVSSHTPDPVGGQLGRRADGSPNGLLYEAAMELVSKVIPPAQIDQITRSILKALPTLWRLGLTGVHDFDRRDCFRGLQNLHARHELKLRVLKSIPLDDLPHAIGLGIHTGFGDDMLRMGSVKVFMDGALGPQTAAMIEPYQGLAGSRGILMLDGEELFEHARQAATAGLSMTVHAIGDRANHEVLDAYEHLRHYEKKHLDSPDLRHRIEHVQILHPDDVGRLAKLNLIASMQPIHATSDMLMADKYLGDRAKFSYAIHSQLQAGARLALGSDAPVESPNPFVGIHAAVTRRRADGTPGLHGWFPEQRLTVLDAVRGFTTGPAFAAHMEDRFGKLAPGFLADLIVLDVDPFVCDPDHLQDILPERTMISGDWVFQR